MRLGEMRYVIYVRRMRLERIGIGEREGPIQGKLRVSKKAGHRTLSFFLFFSFFFQGSRVGECNNCGENKPMDSRRGAIEWRELNCSILVLFEVSSFVDFNPNLKI